MLERYLTETLTKHFGQFVENLDQDQVRLSTWKGEVNLQNLQLRRDALDSLFQARGGGSGGRSNGNHNQHKIVAPVEIAYGKVGNLQLSIPWTVLRSQLTWRGRRGATSSSSQSSQKNTISIVLTDVSILITPRRHDKPPHHNHNDDGDDDGDEEEGQDSASSSSTDRQKVIQDALDAELLKRVAESSANVATTEDTKSWVRDRLTSLLENLSVTVRNIHVRYEDTGACMGFKWYTDTLISPSGFLMQGFADRHHRYRPSFAVGVTLEEFFIGASDSSRNEEEGTFTKKDTMEQHPPTPTSNADNSLYMQMRLVSAKSLAVYWDSASPVISEIVAQKLGTGQDYFEKAFDTLNGENLSKGWSPRGGFAPEHYFVLDPFSPAITLSLVQQTTSSELGGENKPPSQLRGNLPPCRFSFSRSLLEDLGYLKKSFAVWKQTNHGFISETALRRLAGLRPAESPRKDPKGWWRYVLEAITAVNREEAEKSARSSKRAQYRTRLGWLKVSRLLAVRRKYIAAYERFVCATSTDSRSRSHQELVALEDELDLAEIVAFRIHTYSTLLSRGVVGENPIDSPKTSNVTRWGWMGQGRSSSAVVEETKESVYSITAEESHTGDSGANNRLQSFYEMGQAIEKEKSNVTTKALEDCETLQQNYAFGLNNASNPVSWVADVCCGEISLQVNDRRIVHRHRDRPEPVVRLSCAFSQEHCIYLDGSWTYRLRIGSLKVKDCTRRKSRGSSTRNFPNLVGPKRSYEFKENETLKIDDRLYEEVIFLSISRSQHAFRSTALGSTTKSNLRILPLEICYLTAPVEALSRILSSANIDFADDYQRLSSNLFVWRERQKARLLAALSQSNKQILVNIDCSAPTIQIPEGEGSKSPLLLIDLGKLSFSNDDGHKTHVPSMADNWKLSVSHIQVQCTTVGSVSMKMVSGMDLFQQVVEPFSLMFSISTRFHRQDMDSMASAQDQVLVVATLPRLVFNLNSSVVRLLRRLQFQWDERKTEIKTSFLLPNRVIGGLVGRQPGLLRYPPKAHIAKGDRLFQFRFIAPLFRLKFDNDVDGRDSFAQVDSGSVQTTPILDLSLRGIEGELQNRRFASGLICRSFQAKLRSVDAKDLYQQGGSDFCWLLSSISPDMMTGESDERESFSSVTDLVSVTFTSSDKAGIIGRDEKFENGSNRLSIQFHELFVEWNADTIAAIFNAIGLKTDLVTEESTPQMEDDDVFFDAEEDDFHEVGSVGSDDSDIYTLSEISSHQPSFSDLPEAQASTHLGKVWNNSLILPTTRSYLGWTHAPTISNADVEVRVAQKLEIQFELSKLRINFNKETRHRRVFTAEVDHTSVTYSTRQKGGYTAQVSLGNLTLADPQSERNATLYREVLGLKGDTIKSAGENSSLLQMTIAKNPRVRKFAGLEDGSVPSQSMEKNGPVLIDFERGTVHGCDMHISASLSPMRFVYLQQLWFEIVDYAFEGVLGYEVWGNVRPSTSSIMDSLDDRAHAESLAFTKFEVEMESPVILIPVTYCSTDFIRYETESISISNFYSFSPARVYGKTDIADKPWLQWFNNCSVKMNDITLSSWSGRVLNSEHDKVNCDVTIDWPTGPLATRNKPKWHVRCDFDELRISLQRDDYALLQHIIASNISEPSRHLDEWRCLESIPPKARKDFERSIFVHYGYDKKDVTPSTFDVSVRIPLLLFGLHDTERGQIAVAQCIALTWNYKKFSDLVSNQVVNCNISLIGREGDSERMMLSSHHEWSSGNETIESPTLFYRSTTSPNGDNSKELVIEDGCIHVGYKPWKHFGSFFSNLPSPNFLSPNQVIQVGDRWYRISDESKDAAPSSEKSSLDWIFELGSTLASSKAVPVPRKNRYLFDLKLLHPKIALKSSESALILALETISLSHVGQAGIINRKVRFSGIDLKAISLNETFRNGRASLIMPMDISAEIQQSNDSESSGSTPLQSTAVNVQKVIAQVTFSDLVRASYVIFQLQNDVRDVSAASTAHARPVTEASSKALRDSRKPDTTVSVDCVGLEIALVDDSGRHFADSQELLLLSMRKVTYLSVERFSDLMSGRREKSLTLAFQDLCVRDSLQSDVSPFRDVLLISAGPSYNSFLSSKDSSSLSRICGDVERGIEMSQFVSAGVSKYTLGIHLIEMQYNPSLVVALQRFLGRLLKTVKTKIRQFFDSQAEQLTSSDALTSPPSNVKAVKAEIFLKNAIISLNKEHQGRSLLQLNIADVELSAERDKNNARMKGRVRVFSASDANEYNVVQLTNENRPILRMRKDNDTFLEFEYISFLKNLTSETFDAFRLPSWVLDYTQENFSQIDDYLSVSVASLETIYLSSRTSELIDYLSNGLPGKGMGLTSRAAKGFVAERIQKKSFLQINVDAPVLFVPKNESESVGIMLGGDIRARSWIDVLDSTRKLSLMVTCLSLGVYSEGFHQPTEEILSNVDVTLNVLRDISDNTKVDCVVSNLFARITYSAFSTVMYVMRENVSRKIDKSKWDNVEAAWENEVLSDATNPAAESPRHITSLLASSFSTEIVYSSDARHVRYGQGRRRSQPHGTSRFDVTVALEDLSVVLRRDDPSGTQKLEPYDMMLFRAQGFEASLSSIEDGSSASLSIHRVFVFDTGSRGRHANNGASVPVENSVVVLVEGYVPSQTNGTDSEDTSSPQFILRVDRSAILGGKDYRISLVLNYLGVAALIVPLQEISSFLRLEWPTAYSETNTLKINPGTLLYSVRTDVNVPTQAQANPSRTEEVRYHVQLVLHYPQFIFTATENDLNSRALVLRGLAIVKGRKTTHSVEGSNSLKVNADFQNVSSHIVPDSSEILCISSRHYKLVTECLPEYAGVYGRDGHLSSAEKIDELGVALLLPVTVGLEFEQIVSPRIEIGTQRTLGLNMDPLSILLSAEDLVLVASLFSRWSSSKSPNQSAVNADYYEVVFESDRLGLGLRRESRNIVVDASHGNERIEVGDILHSINGDLLSNSTGLPLAAIVDRLREEPRPLCLGFVRTNEKIEDSNRAQESVKPKAKISMLADLSFSKMMVTLIDQDSSLLKAKISETRVNYQLQTSQDLVQKLSLTSTISVDYYNLRIWQWEPLLESCTLQSSTEYSKPFAGPRLLSLEMGDGDSSPLCINLTDAGASVLAKLHNFGAFPEAFSYNDTTGQTANAVIQFAKRQKYSGGKPFVFQNRSGLSCAFAVQKKVTDLPATRSGLSLLGEYCGLEQYSDSEVHVVAPNSECRFRVNRPGGDRGRDQQGLRPCLTIAFQSIVGTVLQPIHDVQMVRPGEYLLALSHRSVDGDHGHSKVWVSWKVEVSDEKTILTLSSTVRICSHLVMSPIEVGIKDEKGHMTILCSPPHKQDIHLPVWLSLKEQFKLLVRPTGAFEFATFFEFSSAMPIPEGSHDVRYVECKPRRSSSTSVWLACRVIRSGAVLVVTIDCCMRLLNYYPIPLQWEISAQSNMGRRSLDGSTTRDGPLEVGACAEVLGNQHDCLCIRLKSLAWSSWVSLSYPPEGDSCFHNIALKDIFGVPLVVGLRTQRQTIGIEVTLFAETWFLNTTAMNINFGAPSATVFPSDTFSAASSGFEELTTAEAALKEISALFETGEGGRNLRVQHGDADTMEVCLLPSHSGTIVTEECFEYIHVSGSEVRRRWWGTESPHLSRPNLTLIKDDSPGWRWIDSEWMLDKTKATPDAWESAPKLKHFGSSTNFDPSHKFRRRRWYRRRLCEPGLTTAFSQSMHSQTVHEEIKDHSTDDSWLDNCYAIRVDGGPWAMTTHLPAQGVVYGAIRAASRPPGDQQDRPAEVYELCYSLSPLEGEFGELSRLMTVSSRFLVYNESEAFAFEMKQVGCPDSTARVVSPGASSPFHWSDRLLPALICVRPVRPGAGQPLHKWTGGFDPLTIGVTPLRVRDLGCQQNFRDPDSPNIYSLRAEAAIRPRSGGAGINLSLREEDPWGQGCLFRIDNCSPFPFWFSQDGLLANPTSVAGWHSEGDMIKPGERMPFALDVPFRQGKYKHRKAASVEELLRVRISLAPLNSRAGIEATMVVSMAKVGDTVRLNPMKLPLLSKTARETLNSIRVIGVITNDGPTRVLNLVPMRKEEKIFSNPFKEDLMSMNSPDNKGKVGPHAAYIIESAEKAAVEVSTGALTVATEDRAIASAMFVSPPTLHKGGKVYEAEALDVVPKNGSSLAELIVSLRVAFSGFTISLIDSAPSEIATVTLKNLNAIASWNAARTTDSTIYLTLSHFQMDNMVPNAPYPVAICPVDRLTAATDAEEDTKKEETAAPLLVIGISVAPRHHSGVEIIKSVTIALKDIAIRADLAFLVRLQKLVMDLQKHFLKSSTNDKYIDSIAVPDLKQRIEEINKSGGVWVNSRMFYFGGLTILPFSIQLSVAPARALTNVQAVLEGAEAAAIHQAVRKGDVKIGNDEVLLGVKIGHRNDTPLAVVRGMFKSIVVDALLRLDGASLNFSGISLTNHVATGPQLATYVAAHYMGSLRKNVPTLVGSLAALGNPLGLIRNLGSGASDFVLEPVKGFQRSVKEMDASYLVDGVARGTLSLARHTVGGFANSAAALTETFSKNMTVLALDRKYAQKRDREEDLRSHHGDINVAIGLGSGVQKLVHGFLEGVTGVVRAPIRGAEKRGIEGFAKGIGKGLLGLLVKPLIGISDGLTDVMIGVKGSVDGTVGLTERLLQIRPRRPFYGRERAIGRYNFADAAAVALMQRTRLAGEMYLSHLDMGNRLALLSIKRLILLGPSGEELLVLKYKHIERAEMQAISLADGTPGWGIVLVLNTPRRNGSEVEVINCREEWQATTLLSRIEEGMRLNDFSPETVELTPFNY